GLTGASPELGRLRLQLGVLLGRFDPASFPADAFWFAGAQTGARVSLGETLRLLGGYRYERRAPLEGTGDPDTLHYLDARLSYRPTPKLALEPRASHPTIAPGV